MALNPNGTFRVAKQIGSWGAFAQVTVVVNERGNGAPIVSVANDKQLDAEGHYLQGLTYGATYAFKEIPQSESLGILVTDLQTMTVDSTSQAIAYATCFAIWGVLGYTSDSPPFLDEESKAFIFPAD